MYNSIRINDADELMPPPFILSAKKAAELTGLCYATVINTVRTARSTHSKTAVNGVFTVTILLQ